MGKIKCNAAWEKTVKYRHPALVAFLSLILPGIYWAYWYMTTADELRRAKLGTPPDKRVALVGWLILLPIYYFCGLTVFSSFHDIGLINLPLYGDVLLVIFLVFLSIPVFAFYAVYWRSIGMVSDRWDDAIFAVFAFLLIPPLALTIAQHEMNRYAKVTERCRRFSSPAV